MCIGCVTRSARTWRCAARRRAPSRSSQVIRTSRRRSSTCTSVRRRLRVPFGCWILRDPFKPWQHGGNGIYRDGELLSIERVKWWRRRESNPRPRARPRGTLHAYPLLFSHARREETAKNRQAPVPVHLTTRRRDAIRSPACLMASDPQPPGEVGADAHSLLSCESVLSIRS